MRSRLLPGSQLLGAAQGDEPEAAGDGDGTVERLPVVASDLHEVEDVHVPVHVDVPVGLGGLFDLPHADPDVVPVRVIAAAIQGHRAVRQPDAGQARRSALNLGLHQKSLVIWIVCLTR